jgi:hypothetical protein
MRLSIADDGLPEQCVFYGGDVVPKWEKVQEEHNFFKLKEDIYKPDFGYSSPQKIRGVKECTNPAFKDHRLHKIGWFKIEYSDGSNGLKGWSAYAACTMCGQKVKKESVFFPDNDFD